MGILKKKYTQKDVGNAMTDISFLLIIFFLVATVFVSDEGLTLLLPDKNIQPEKKASIDVVQIHLMSNGIKLETEDISEEMLRTALAQRAATNPELTAIMNVDNGVNYARVIDILSLVRSAGILSFTLQDLNTEDFLIPIKIEQEGY